MGAHGGCPALLLSDLNGQLSSASLDGWCRQDAELLEQPAFQHTEVMRTADSSVHPGSPAGRISQGSVLIPKDGPTVGGTGELARPRGLVCMTDEMVPSHNSMASYAVAGDRLYRDRLDHAILSSQHVGAGNPRKFNMDTPPGKVDPP